MLILLRRVIYDLKERMILKTDNAILATIRRAKKIAAYPKYTKLDQPTPTAKNGIKPSKTKLNKRVKPSPAGTSYTQR